MEVPKAHDSYEKLKDHMYVNYKNHYNYGLRVSSRKWYEKFRDALIRLNFTICPFQPCLFIWRKEKQFIIFLLYVDDAIAVFNHKQKMVEVEKRLGKDFEIKNLGSPKKYLGLEMKRNFEDRILYLHQRQFIEKMLKRFKMEGCKEVGTPMITKEGERKSMRKVRKLKGNNTESIHYREAVGSLLYLSEGTRPDIAYAVNALSKTQNNYTTEDWVKVKRVFRYLKAVSYTHLTLPTIYSV